jgi:hypothetical protein
MHLTRLFGLIGLGVLAGCTPSAPPLTPVAGTVTLDDQPLAGALVKFLPQGDTQGHGGFGKTDANGRYEIAPQRLKGKGLSPGEYKVIVSRKLQPDGTPLPPDAKPIETGAIESVPEPYCKLNLTPLTVTISAEAKIFDISLKK